MLNNQSRSSLKLLGRCRTCRSVVALILREMSTSYGRSPGGYIWAVAEPVLVLGLLSVVFSFIINSPPIGKSFPLFYATGYLPFMVFNDVANKTATALRYSKPLLQYPTVTYVDAVLARAILHFITHALVGYIVFCGIFIAFDINYQIRFEFLFIGYLIGGCLGIGVGLINCYLFMSIPAWERIWQIITRPLVFISGLFLTYDSLPLFAKEILWWNPLIHTVGLTRMGIFDFYNGSYVSIVYPLMFSLAAAALGFLLLLRNHSRLLEN